MILTYNNNTYVYTIKFIQNILKKWFWSIYSENIAVNW